MKIASYLDKFVLKQDLMDKEWLLKNVTKSAPTQNPRTRGEEVVTEIVEGKIQIFLYPKKIEEMKITFKFLGELKWWKTWFIIDITP